ncbi:FAD:protein FMN transferase [Aureispira anguillae]|uniref:FAD:protein FMN transferase n=1 Tax=Aureispira anguillae TaxID=2864201 RepID=A0A915YGB2_9BACT|nr:FAD:protein FMN transferase [Aureispira anguillae]BDS12517.1 FAD:protein FMN transferase [Aureispira anguillae]
MHLLFFLLFPFLLSAQITTDETEAIQLAKEGEKPILLVFSGSDWCQPCIRFDKNILQNDDFKTYIQEKLVVLKCDFPQRLPLTAKTIQQNERLAEQFNPNGEFPSLVLLNTEFKKITKLGYTGQSVDQFKKEIEAVLPAKTTYKEYRKKVPLMGSFFEFILVAPTQRETETWQLINDCIAEGKRIEQLISEWIPSSDISRINQSAGQDAVTVQAEVYQLLQRSLMLSELTQGAFDITFLAYYEYWKFDKTQVFPFDSAKIQDLAQYVDYRQVLLLPDNRVQLPSNTKIGLGGIGQGYAVDQIKQLLLKKGIENFVINSSGDIYAQGNRLDGSAWRVGIASPSNKDEIVQWLPVENFAVVTSGTSEKNFEYQNTIYSHIINPKTGFPVEGIQSATVISEFTEVADALATSILVLGTEIGLDLINQMPKTHCVIIDRNQNIHYSNDLEIKN